MPGQIPIEWRASMPFDQNLFIRSDTYNLMPPLFPDVVPIYLTTNEVANVDECHYRASKDGHWRYVRRILKPGQSLDTYYSTQKGRVRFDGPVEIPAMWEFRNERWNTWMSLTPMEHFSLRGGSRRAKGVTVIVGLGMGYQLFQVAKRQKVKSIIVVERSQDLVDFVIPALEPMLNNKSLEVIIGDANEVLPKLTADIALVDIFATYGGNKDDLDLMRARAGGIKDWWGWGTAPLAEPEADFISSILGGLRDTRHVEATTRPLLGSLEGFLV